MNAKKKKKTGDEVTVPCVIHDTSRKALLYTLQIMGSNIAGIGLRNAIGRFMVVVNEHVPSEEAGHTLIL